MRKIEDSELILNKDGSIFHLKIKPGQLANTVILVGDPGRAKEVSKHFDKIEYKSENREFISHTGEYKGKKITVLSTGIGTDNIDIVLNELDALVNIDFNTRMVKKDHTSLDIIRLGTSGALQKDIPVDSFVASQVTMGIDGLLNFYQDRDLVSILEMEQEFVKKINWGKKLAIPYFVKSSENLLNNLAHDYHKGITVSASGFYGPQGRVLRLPIQDNNINKKLSECVLSGYRFTNYEMEGSAINGLSKLLGHNSLTICAIIANRFAKTFSGNYKNVVEKLIINTLERLANK